MNKKPFKTRASKQINPKKSTNKLSIESIKKNRAKQFTAQEYVDKILSGNITFLSKAITLIESTNPKHQKKANLIINNCLPHANKSKRIGITGVPGVGKSTFIEAYGKHLTSQGEKVAVLTVDPSSSLHKGSILGDKTRMEQLVTDKNAFIRPSPAGNSLGGVAQKTRETILLCEAAGFTTIIIETVGVGQSETLVHSMVDFFLLLKLPGAGDDLQGIKRGIIELADAIVINKADGENEKNAKIAKIEFSKALHLYPLKESQWIPKVLLASALKNKGIVETHSLITEYFKLTKENNYFNRKRKIQNKEWLISTINQQLLENFYSKPTVKSNLEQEIKAIENGKTTPFFAAKKLLEL